MNKGIQLGNFLLFVVVDIISKIQGDFLNFLLELVAQRIKAAVDEHEGFDLFCEIEKKRNYLHLSNSPIWIINHTFNWLDNPCFNIFDIFDLVSFWLIIPDE